jgi:hypothetical protein
MNWIFSHRRVFCVRGVFLVLALIFLPLAALAADPPLPTDPMAIRNELRTLRKKSADNDKTVRARIDALLRQLQKLQGERDAAESQARGEARPSEEGEPAAMTREKMYDKVQQRAARKLAEKEDAKTSTATGETAKGETVEEEGSTLDLAEPVREQIVKEYEEDRDPTIKNPHYYQEQTVLVIDFSRKEATALVAAMDKFTGITTLILAGGANGAPVDLATVLNRARKMPLTELCIINFRHFVTAIPESVGQFADLTRLSLFSNNVATLPLALGKMMQLRVLHVDMNPISTLLPTIRGLVFLQELGVGKTSISAAERGQIASLLPNCKVMIE